MSTALLDSNQSSRLPTSATKRVLVVDDDPGFRSEIRQLLTGLPEVTVCGEATDAPAALDLMRRGQPDMAILDVFLPGSNGIELIKLMLAERPRLAILMLSTHDESLYALRALRAGAKGYVMKQRARESLSTALQKVMNGGIYVSPQFSECLVFKAIQGSDSDLGSPVDKLSDRELEVLQLVGRRKSTREIAAQLHLSIKTIETHRAHTKQKLGFSDSAAMVKFAIAWVATSETVT